MSLDMLHLKPSSTTYHIPHGFWKWKQRPRDDAALPRDAAALPWDAAPLPWDDAALPLSDEAETLKYFR